MGALCLCLSPADAEGKTREAPHPYQASTPQASAWLTQAWRAIHAPDMPTCFACLEPPRRRPKPLKKWHKALGVAATLLLLATSIVGDKNVLDTWDNRLPSQGWRAAHQGLVIGTSAVYLASQVISWLDPLVYKYPPTRRAYEILRWIHTIGFVTLIGLGLLTARLTPGATTAKIVASVAHMSVGYITIGALGFGTLLLFF